MDQERKTLEKKNTRCKYTFIKHTEKKIKNMKIST